MASEQAPSRDVPGDPGPGRLRHGPLIRAVLEVLDRTEGPLAAAEVVDRVADRVEPTPYELSRNASGVRRFETAVRFASSWMRRVGWLDKDRTTGRSITAAGRRALDLHPGTRRRPAPFGGWTDPRWEHVRECVEAIPEGPGRSTRTSPT